MRRIENRKPGSVRLHSPQATQSLLPTATAESLSGITVRGACSGIREDEILGQPLTVLMPERYRDAHQRGLERVRSTGDQRTYRQGARG